MARILGKQTARVWVPTRGEHGERGVDGPVQVWDDCVLLPVGGSESRGGTESRSDGRVTETRRWNLFAGPGRRAPASAMCTVTPGPLAADGQPLRLSFSATAEPVWDRKGVEVYVGVEVRSVGD